MADYNNYNAPQYNNVPQNNAPQYGAPQYNAPQYGAPQYNAPQYGAAPAGPAAPEKKPFPVKIIAIAAVALVAVIVLIAILAGGVPGSVKEDAQDVCENWFGVEIKSIKKEYKVSKDGAHYYVISGKVKDVADDEFEDAEDYVGGYFYGMAIEYDGDAEFMPLGIYEKDDKDDFKDDLKEFLDECKDNKDDIKDMLEEHVEEEEE